MTQIDPAVAPQIFDRALPVLQPGYLPLPPSSRVSHLPFLAWLVAVLRPRILVELGVGDGASYCTFCETVAHERLSTACFGIDAWAGVNGDAQLAPLRAHHDLRYAAFSRLVRSTADDALEHFADAEIDLLHLGGDDGEEIRLDLTKWRTKLSDRAIVLVHGIDTSGTGRVWDEISRDRQGFRFLHGGGLGMLAMGEVVAEPLRHLLSARQDRIAELRTVFGQLGQSLFELSELRHRVVEQASDLRFLREALADADRQSEEGRHERDALTAAIRGYGRDLAGKQVALDRMREALDRQASDLEQFGRRVAEAEAAAEERLRLINAVKRSRSWRLTKPLRRLGLFGRSEKRLLRRGRALPGKAVAKSNGAGGELSVRENGALLQPGRDYVLVVSHEASRSGAPILALNICRELQQHFNVVVLLLGGGGILRHFQDSCSVVVGPHGPFDPSLPMASVVAGIHSRYAVKFAIVNSLASRAILQPLAEHGVPSLLLIHEFFRLICSPDELADAFAWAGGTVFSASLVRDSATIDATRPAARMASILPQGLSTMSDGPVRPEPGEARSQSLRRSLLGDGAERSFFLLGVGTVEYRKGVDLFIATAAAVRRLAPDLDIRAVWIGPAFDWSRPYPEFVTTQIEQSGVQSIVRILGERSDIDEIYPLADLCFISSRLDPLPNVAIEAMAAGVPVMCFDRATGIAEHLSADPETADCVVPFMDVEEAARRIIALGRSPERRSRLSRQVRSLAAQRFDMKRYVSALADLSGGVAAALRQVQEDVAVLQAGDDFVADFYLPPGSRRTRDQAIWEFAKSCQAGIYRRKPTPGFDPHLYARHAELMPAQGNPFVHFLRSGRPSGPWQEDVIDVSRGWTRPTAVPNAAVHIHAFYPELVREIADRLALNDLPCDLFVSTTSDLAAREVNTSLRHYRTGSCDVRVVPNRGRDLGPFLTEFAADLSGYDVIGHFHTKKSLHVASSQAVRNWVEFLLENLLGGRSQAAGAILSAFAEDDRLGLVLADDPHLIGWGDNRPFAEALARRMGIADLPDQFFPFPVGTMFWARPAALAPLFDLCLGWHDYPDEPLAQDGSILHAIERLLPSIVSHAGFVRRVTYAPGVGR